MATRKKKTESHDPTVVKGTHLTVTTFPDGKTLLKWDDKALLKEVRLALKSVAKTKRKIIKEKQ